ncbi:unnamed protein product [Linum tenue]|uniref:Uncharacterized protein n=1 Tax=Linum tenue TaxID=586396 RepID=A0AAV0JXY2_9ROSI|nr:unnamed protein product [Linum tenue]
MGLRDPGASQDQPNLARHLPGPGDRRGGLRRGGAGLEGRRGGPQLPRVGRVVPDPGFRLPGRYPQCGRRGGRHDEGGDDAGDGGKRAS